MPKPPLTNQKSKPIAIPKAPQGTQQEKGEKTKSLAEKAGNFPQYHALTKEETAKLVAAGEFHQRPNGKLGRLSQVTGQ